MKSSKVEQVQDVPITADHWDVPIPLCPTAYARFCREMDESLRELVALWSHLAAPCSHGGTRTRRSRRP